MPNRPIGCGVWNFPLGVESMKFQYSHRSKADLLLQLLDHAVEDDIYASVLSTLAAGINAAANRIDDAEQNASPEMAQFVAEDEVEVIESLLGTAYVLCQTPITAVTQAALRARKQALDDGLTFPAFAHCHEVRALGGQFDAQYSKIEVLWALANYFKHRDEWRRSTWTKPTGPAKRTVPVLSAAGLQPFSTGNLRTGAEVLGNTDYSRLTVFEDIITCWANEVRSVTRKAFGR
jgi:hypothetical protein